MNCRSMGDIERALDEGRTVRLEGDFVIPPARRPGTRLMLSEEAKAAIAEEEEYRAFAASLGLEPPEPVRLVRIPRREYDALKREADR